MKLGAVSPRRKLLVTMPALNLYDDERLIMHDLDMSEFE